MGLSTGTELGLAAAGSAVGSAFSAASAAPTAVPVTAPAPVFPGATSSFLQELQSSGVGASSLNSLASIAANGSMANVAPAVQAMETAAQPQIQQGQTNIVEQLGAAGLSQGSDIDKAVSTYNTNVTNDFESTLSNFQLQALEQSNQEQLSAATAGAGLTSNIATTLAPTEVIASGTPSATGSAISSASSSLSQYALLAAMGLLA